MKSSFKKIRGFVGHKPHHHHGSKEKRDFNSLAQLDEVAQACEDMQDMRDCYDTLLSAAAATANCAYEFSVSLREMGACLLEKTALNDDEESGKVLLMLGKVQFELQKLVDSYRSHISKTITTPSESLLNELRTVEVMKRQCDEKRAVYEYMLTAQKEKGRSRSSKGENFSSQQLQTARDEYDDEATLFIFRLKSLKQGQSRSLLTQAARHHAAQLNLFRKGLKSLEAVDPNVKLVADQQHIDYQFSGLEDDEGEDGYDDEGYDANDDGELSFDYGNDDQDVSSSRNSMELDQVVDSSFPASTVEATRDSLDKFHGDLFSFNREPRPGSQSEPIFAEKRFDVAERIRQMQHEPRKFHTYVLPTPLGTKTTALAGLSNPVSHSRDSSFSQSLWNSSPLGPKGLEKELRDDRLLGAPNMKLHSVLKESNTNNPSLKLPPPLNDGFSQPQLDPRTADSKKTKRQAFSGPISSKPWSASKPGFSSSGPISAPEQPHFSGGLPRFTILKSSSPKISPCPSPPFMSSPKISELHELPRPPVSSSSTRPSGFVGHSAPLFPRSQEGSTKMPTPTSYTASPLPMPPLTVPRSFSIPSNSQRAKGLHMARLSEVTESTVRAEETDSPPLTPLSLTSIKPASTTYQLDQAKG